MKKLVIAATFATGLMAGIEAAPTDAVTQADLQALIQRIQKLESQNQAQAKRIAELEAADKKTDMKLTEQSKKFELQTTTLSKMATCGNRFDEETTTNETGRIYTTGNGKKYYLADASAKIFEPLSESGLQITPYGYLVLEGVYSDRQLDGDYTTDFVSRNSDARNNTTLSVQDSIFGVQFMTPEATHGWRFSGKAEFDLVDTSNVDQNHYGFHWRHLYVNAEHAETGWSVLFGQTWHLWKIVTPSEIDGAWMEQAGHPYRRSPQIRVTKKWDMEDSSFEVRAGILKGGPGMGEDRDADGIQDNTASPWALFETALVYDHEAAWQEDGRRWLFGFGGMYGQNRSHNMNYTREDDYESMMALFAASAPFGDFTLTGQIFGGENLGGIQAGCGQTVYFHNAWDRGDEVRTIGGFIDLSYQINDTWSVAGGYGFDDPNDDDVKGGVNNNGWPSPGVMWNDRAYVAAFYQVTANCKFGLEYARLLTTYDESSMMAGDGDYGANRVQFSAFYDF